MLLELRLSIIISDIKLYRKCIYTEDSYIHKLNKAVSETEKLTINKHKTVFCMREI